jgi:hypothetical protein
VVNPLLAQNVTMSTTHIKHCPRTAGDGQHWGAAVPEQLDPINRSKE